MAGREKIDFAGKFAVGDMLWVPHETEAFLCGRVESVTQTRMEVKVEGQSENLKFIANNKDPMPAFEAAGGHIHDNVDNLVDLDELSEPAILHHARKRFKKKLIYTHVGSILVAINPFERLDIYGLKDMQKAQKDYFPHVFVTAATAYKQLLENNKNQSVLISGESGAGKTETTKKVLSYLATVAKAPSRRQSNQAGGGGDDVTIEDKILQSNPLLEAMGNAKTLRNNNSSRFGKYMRVDFDSAYKISGCEIINYLLEKSRVVVQTDNERNYHIFYQLIRGLDTTTMTKLLLKDDVMYYNYLNQSGCDKIDGVDDRSDFQEVMQAVKTLQFSQQLQNDMLTILAAILHIGNIEFEESHNRDSCIISPNSAGTMKCAAQLLGVEVNSLSFSLTDKLVSVGRASVVGMKLNLNQALDGRDSLAKTLYSSMFDYIITQVNATLKLSDNGSKSSGSIGILDIFGFEIFQVNSFEQLCINYANEKLQHHFNDVIFNEEKKMYEYEGVSVAEIKFEDNSLCVALVEGKPFGLLSILDEECSLGNATDLSYAAKAEKTFGKDKAQANAYFIKHKTKPNFFAVKHFAGNVDYCTDGFLDKNRDTMSKTTIDMIVQSKVPLIRSIFEMKAAAAAAQEEKGGGGGKKLSLGGNFRSQLIGLLTTLRATEPHFIRCVKPNELKKGGILDGNMTLRQLRYAGLFEAIRIRKSGYSYRASHDVFANLYRLLLDEKTLVKCKRLTSTEICKEILAEAHRSNILQAGISFLGTTRVFLKSSSHKTLLERAKANKVTKFVVTIQKICRMFLAKVVAFKLKYEKTKIKQAEYKEKMRFHIASTIIKKYYRGHAIRLATSMLGELCDLRRHLTKRDMISVKFLVTRLDNRLKPGGKKSNNNGYKSRNESMAKFRNLLEDDRDDQDIGLGLGSGFHHHHQRESVTSPSNGRHGSQFHRAPKETPKQRYAKFMHGLVEKEVFLAKAFIRLFDMQHFYLDLLSKAIESGELLKINDLVLKCEKVDLVNHETVVRAKRELQMAYSKKVLLEKMLYFLKFNPFSSNVINLPLSTRTHFYNIGDITDEMPSCIADARRLQIDEAFCIKVEQIYNNVIPKLGLQNRFRRALKLVDIGTVITCVNDVANMTGYLVYAQGLNPDFHLKVLDNDEEIKTLDDAEINAYEEAIHAMLNLIDNLPPRQHLTPGSALISTVPIAIGAKLVFLEKELRASRSLFAFAKLESLLDEQGDGIGPSKPKQVANTFVPLLSETIIGLCRTLARSKDEQRTAELQVLLIKKCQDDIHIYERAVRLYKWSSLITSCWDDEESLSSKDLKVMQEESFFGYNCFDARRSPYVKNFLLTTNEVSPSKKIRDDLAPEASPLQTVASGEMDLPVSVVNTIRSCNKLNLSNEKDNSSTSLSSAFNSPASRMAGTPNKTPKKTPLSSSLSSSANRFSMTNQSSGVSGATPASSSKTPASSSKKSVAYSPFKDMYNNTNDGISHPHLSTPRKAALDTGTPESAKHAPPAKSPSESMSKSTPQLSPSPKVLFSPGAAELFKYKPKNTDFLSPHAAMYEDIVAKNTIESEEEKQQHERLVESRAKLSACKQDMKHLLNKMHVYNKSDSRSGWK